MPTDLQVDIALPSKEEKNKEVCGKTCIAYALEEHLLTLLDLVGGSVQVALEIYLSSCLRECTVRQSVVLAAFVQAPEALYNLSDALRKNAQ